MRLGNAFLLHGFDGHLMSETPYDKVAIIREVTLAGGSGTIDLSTILYNVAECDYVLLKQATLAAGVLTVANTAIGDTDTVSVLILTDMKNIKKLNE